MEVYYLTVEDVEELHDLAIDRYDGIRGREVGKLESILYIPQASFKVAISWVEQHAYKK